MPNTFNKCLPVFERNECNTLVCMFNFLYVFTAAFDINITSTTGQFSNFHCRRKIKNQIAYLSAISAYLPKLSNSN